MKKVLFQIVPILLLFSSCINFKEDYYLESPDGQQVLTFVTVDNLIEPIFSERMKSGIYMFLGHFESSKKLPNEYLKLKYSDFPIGILWNDTIAFSYRYIEENKFINSSRIAVYENVSRDKFMRLDSIYRTKSVSKKTTYFIDEIFSK